MSVPETRPSSGPILPISTRLFLLESGGVTHESPGKVPKDRFSGPLVVDPDPFSKTLVLEVSDPNGFSCSPSPYNPWNVTPLRSPYVGPNGLQSLPNPRCPGDDTSRKESGKVDDVLRSLEEDTFLLETLRRPDVSIRGRSRYGDHCRGLKTRVVVGVRRRDISIV